MNKAIATLPGEPTLHVKMTKAERAEIEEFQTRQVVKQAEAAKTLYQEQRRMEYPRTDELIAALWEKFVENRPEADAQLQALQAKRDQVKAKYPKGA